MPGSTREPVVRPLPRPSDDFRKKSWRLFQAALDRHLRRRDLRRRGGKTRERFRAP